MSRDLKDRMKAQAALPERIENIAELLVKRERMLARQIVDAETDEDYVKIEKLKGRIDRAERIYDELTGQLNSATLAPLKDSFSITSEVITGEDCSSGVFNVTITNSPYDITYVPNDPLVLEYKGCKKGGKRKTRRCAYGMETLTNEDYWTEGLTGTQTVSVSGKGFARLIEDFDLSSLSLGRDGQYPTDQLTNVTIFFDQIA